MVVDQVEARLVEHRACVYLCDRKSHSIGKALSERSSRDFDTLGNVGFWVTGSDAVDVLEKLSANPGTGSTTKPTLKFLRSSIETL